jgi:hypothetical protein
MTANEFLEKLQTHAASFAKAVATNEGEWIIKGFIDVYQRIYTISVDTKIVSKVLELLLFPMFTEFGRRHGLKLELCPQQNFYPDLTFIHELTWGRQVRENPLHLTPMIISNKKVISKERPQRPAIPNKSFSPPEQSSVVAMAM